MSTQRSGHGPTAHDPLDWQARDRANHVHCVLLRTRPLRAENIYALPDLYNFPRGLLTEVIADLAADGRLTETPTGYLQVHDYAADDPQLWRRVLASQDTDGYAA